MEYSFTQFYIGITWYSHLRFDFYILISQSELEVQTFMCFNLFFISDLWIFKKKFSIPLSKRY